MLPAQYDGAQADPFGDFSGQDVIENCAYEHGEEQQGEADSGSLQSGESARGESKWDNNVDQAEHLVRADDKDIVGSVSLMVLSRKSLVAHLFRATYRC